MGLLKIRWQDDRPSDEAVAHMWDQLRVRETRWRNTDVRAVVNSLNRVHPGGGAWLRCFHVAPQPVFDWYVSRNRFDEVGILTRFFALPLVLDGIPHLGPTQAYYSQLNPIALPEFQWISSFTLDGEIANDLAEGGPYERIRSGFEAKSLGRQFTNALFGDRYTEVKVLRSTSRWAEWFRGVIWDCTWLIIDKRRRNIWLLCVTDSDC